jgi:hypothetical protein
MFGLFPKSLNKDVACLFLISFLILYFELVCIRWVSSTVTYVGLFSNIILLAAFLGIGVGCTLSGRKLRLLDHFPVAVFFFVLLFSVGAFRSTIYSRALFATAGGLLTFTPGAGVFLNPSLMLILIFAFVSLLFIPLSQEMGLLFRRFKPLSAYSLNVGGSLAGICAFTAMSYLSLGPVWWFGTFYLLLFAFKALHEPSSTFTINFWIFLPVTLMCLTYGLEEVAAPNELDVPSVPQVYWSPYYRIDKIGDIITVNKIGHQTIRVPPQMETVQYPPRYLINRTFDDVLIIGSGTGTDTALALFFNASRIDAVEIDPLIIKLGQRYHPARPYFDPKVTVINDDARSYLTKTDKRYDLIIYGLTDSITALSMYGNLRLESYLYTTEAFADVKAHLKEGGLFVTGNYYPQTWFADKLDVMLQAAFGQRPHIMILPAANEELGEVHGVMTFSGPAVSALGGPPPRIRNADVVPSTDDWPFFYMQRPSLPGIYSQTIALIMAFSLLLLFVAGRFRAGAKISPRFFFLGAAFMLLETKSLINFSLLFGATWLVNSLVFISVLCAVLVAVYTVNRLHIRNLTPWYALLFVALLMNYLIPLSAFLPQGPFVRYVLCSLLLFSPIFAANIIFSASFKDTKESDLDFASNILGCLFGGIAEYLSLIAGYRNLTLLIAAFYLLSLNPWTARKK